MAIREGAWDCPVCGRTANRGPHKFCGGCGSPRGKEVKFYLPDDAKVVSDEAELNKAKAGPDWNCSFCGGDNPSSFDFCSGCGGSKDGTSKRDVTVKKNAPTQQKATQPKAPAKKPNYKVLIGCAIAFFIAFILFTGVGLILNISHDENITLKGFSWERSISIEKFKTLTEKAWEGEQPSDARIISKNKEVHHYNKIPIGTETKTRTVTKKVQVGTEKVKVGQKDLGNGYFEDVYEDRPIYEDKTSDETYQETIYKDEPVYKTRYTYEIDRWVFERIEKASGTDQNASWPTDRIREKEREQAGKRTEKYIVYFTGKKGKEITYETKDEKKWLLFEPGKTYKAKITIAGKIKKIEGLDL